jgi:uncharacterized protein (DUF1778 family)
LKALLSLVPASERFPLRIEHIVDLNPYAVGIRYADDWREPHLGDAGRALAWRGRSAPRFVKGSRLRLEWLTCTGKSRTWLNKFMKQQGHNRTARIEARIAPEALAVVRRAAEIQGRSISDFVVAAAQDAARRTVAEVEVIRLSLEAQEQFVSMLLNPPPPSDVLLRALERPAN